MPSRVAPRFHPLLSRIDLIIPLLGVLLLFASFYFVGLEGFFGRHRGPFQFVSRVIFLNNIHVIFTFVMLLTVPQLRLWVAESDKSRRVPLRWHFVLVFLLFAAVFAIRKYHGGLPGQVLFVLAQTYAYAHVVRQSMGISFLHNRHAGPITPEKASLERHERRLIYAGIVVYAIDLFCLTFNLQHQLATPRLILFGVMLVASVAFMIQTYRTTKGQGPAKTLFTARYLGYPLAASSTIALVFGQMTHGFEYFMVSQKIWRTSGTTLNMMSGVGWTLLLVIVYLSLLNTFDGLWVFFPNVTAPEFYQNAIFLVIFPAIAHLHYYTDGLLFRMRHRHVREHVLALL